MTEKQPFYKTHRNALIVVFILGLGPLTALTVGSKVADEETIARAEAGDRNMPPEDKFEQYEPPTAAGAAAERSVVTVIDDSAPFQPFYALVKKADMAEVLDQGGPYTLFAPADDAFEGLSEQRRQELMDSANATDLVSAHVANGRIVATDLLEMDSVDTLGGRSFSVGNGGDLSIGNAEIIKSDLVAGNGIVHVVDGFVF